MKTDIALVLLPSWGITDPPLTLSTLSSYLRSHSIHVKVFDFNIETYHLLSQYREYWNLSHGLEVWQQEDFISKLWKDYETVFNSLIDDVIQSGCKYASFSVFVSNRLITERFAKELKERMPSVQIVFGGPEIAYLEDLDNYLVPHPYIDYLVKGEDEEALLKIVSNEAQKGIIQVQNVIGNLDTLPLLDLSDYDFEAYLDTLAFPMYSSRGCPNLCIYCTERDFMGRFRTRSAERIYEDVLTQITKYPHLKMFRLHESTSNGNIKELERFCDLMIDADLGISWAINGAVMRKEMNGALCRKLRKAGCVLINYGLETPSHKVLEYVGKKLSRNTDFDSVVQATHNAGIQATLNIMFGLPKETEEDFQLQMYFLKHNHKYISCIAPSLWFCYFPKGSEGFENASKYGINLKHSSLYWTSEDGTNTYPIRMSRFIRYTNLMYELKVPCVFGYPVLSNRNELIDAYLKETNDYESLRPLNGVLVAQLVSARNENMLRNILKNIIYKVAPYAVHGAVNYKARAKLLEKRLEKLTNT